MDQRRVAEDRRRFVGGTRRSVQQARERDPRKREALLQRATEIAIEEEPERLSEAEGIGAKRIGMIKAVPASWRDYAFDLPDVLQRRGLN